MTASKKTVRTRRGVEPVHPEGAAGPVVHRAALLRRRRPPPPDRSALCDFFDSQRGLAPPGRVRGPRAAREGSGALGGRVLAR